MEKSKRKGLVYSTDKGRICPKCGDPVNQCSCHQGKNRPPENGVVRVSRQTKNRKGSGVCLVTGLPLNDADLKKLVKQLKIQCGTGGTVKNGIIEIQGDHRQKLVDLLVKLGYKARLAGG